MYFRPTVKQVFNQRAYLPFYMLYSLFLIVGCVFLLSTSREGSHLILNQFFFDTSHGFFRYFTHLGDGMAAVLIVLLALFVNYKSALQIGLTSIIAGGTTQLLKNYVFDDVDRPSWFFKHFSEHSIQTIEGMELNIHNSFPSGHTTTAFALYVSIILLVKNRNLSILFTVVALVAGYSRVYLSQHFFVDIYFGSLMGTVWAFLIFWLLERNKKEWFSKSVLKR